MRRRALWRVGAATTLVVLAFSIVNPLLAVALQRQGQSATAIGVFAMLPFLSIAAMLPWLPRLFARVGVARAYRAGLLLEAVGMAGYALGDGYALWCACAVLSSVGAAALWNGSEAMLAFNAPPGLRGRVTGLYQSALGAALALGPFVPGLVTSLLPSVDARTLVAAAPLLLVGALLLVASPAIGRLAVAHADARSQTLAQALRARPGLVWIAFAGGVFEAGLGSIGAAHGSQLGYSVAAATSIAGALGVGSFVLQYPAGWMADHLPLRRVFAAAGALLLLAALAFAASGSWSALLWASAFVWGAVGGALYTLTMVQVAHDFAASSAMAGTAAMIAGYTAGGAFGPVAAGLLLDGFGAAGLAAGLALLAASVLTTALRMRP
jgi:MFS family permease